MFDKERKELVDGTFQIPMARCQLRQRAADVPIIYEGPGIISQAKDGNLQLQMFSGQVDFSEAFRRDHGLVVPPGTLFPENTYYDLDAIDFHETTWHATRLSINGTFGAGTLVQVDLRRLEKVQTFTPGRPGSAGGCFVPTSAELPWHKMTTSDLGSTWDRFEYKDEKFEWELRKLEGGLDIHFWVNEDHVEPFFTRFLRALAILTGRPIDPWISAIREGEMLVTRFHTHHPELVNARLLGPLSLRMPSHQDAHRFLLCFVNNSVTTQPESVDGSELLYRFWHRILRARERDIENSALVLSVAVEGVIKGAFLSKYDIDSEFVELVEGAKERLNRAKCHERIRGALKASLGHSSSPKVKDTLKRLIEQGVLDKAHIEAWEGMRHAAAHGGAWEEDELALQSHIKRFHFCLDLFYRLVFVVIKYRGHHIDLTDTQWAERPFPPQS